MRRVAPQAALVLLLAAVASAQEPAPVYQTQKQAYRFAGDTLARYEWTQDIPNPPDGEANKDRWRLQLRPRFELNLGPVELGVGGEFNYSQDENDQPLAGQETVVIIRDNYRSKDARLDLAYARVNAGPVLIEGGRFFMPIPFTEMIWDRDLRPQGGALTIETAERGSRSRIAATGIYAKGSHVFEDESQMLGGALDLAFGMGPQSQLQLVGSYLQFDDLDRLEPPIRRQNARVAGLIVNEFKVIDVVGRIVGGGQAPYQLVADYCWNTAADDNNRGLWLSAILGAVGTTRARLEYTYAKVDRDATVAAFNADDFFWNTGWEGHRGDVGTGFGRGSSLHAIAQWQRFKDSAVPEERDVWVKRFRIEYRQTF